MCSNNQILWEPTILRPLDFKKTLAEFVGAERVEELIDKINAYYKDLLPMRFEGISFSGLGCFNNLGEYLYFTDPDNVNYNFRIEFKRIVSSKSLTIEETYYFVFN